MANIDQISRLITGRNSEAFASDVRDQAKLLREKIEGKNVLLVGGAGSIGRATLLELARFEPGAIHVLDISENSLVELVRDIRSSKHSWKLRDFRVLPLDYGAVVTRSFLKSAPVYDFVLNFAALKHVRSEKDVFSLIQLLDTNIVKQLRFMRWLSETGKARRYFSVSTDKAANPVNFMGASKRLMEHIIFSSDSLAGFKADVTSARFANVAFSDGSLLAGFIKRLEKSQPIAVPGDTKRYFVTLSESGQICLLAAVLAPSKHLVIPSLEPAKDLKSLVDVAQIFLENQGFTAKIYSDENLAKSSAKSDIASGRFPLLVTPLDTDGEKPYEEFSDDGERVVPIPFSALRAIEYRPVDTKVLTECYNEIERAVCSPSENLSKDDLARWLGSVIPQFRHAGTGKTLDERM